MTPQPFDPEMNGGRQLDLFGQGVAVSTEQQATPPAVAGPTTVVCLKGRRDDPELGFWCPEGEPCHARVLAEPADTAEVSG
ncbi:hypothetical protein [Streptomyces sp. NPDC102437]|uniref:hypothetical protein n=1 Tax=Streptomyces sp. NPDC102437 TaxID=3366175 RepID=UPI0038130067